MERTGKEIDTEPQSPVTEHTNEVTGLLVRVSLPQSTCRIPTLIRGSFPDSQWTKEHQLAYSIAFNEFFTIKLMRVGERFQLLQKERILIHPHFPSIHDPVYGEVNYFPGTVAYRLEAGIAFRGKTDMHYEDAFCVSENFLGLADGVSAWSERGIDAGLFARELVRHCNSSALRHTLADDTSQGLVPLVEIAEESLRRTKAVGSSTLVLASLCGSKLHTLSIGDSQVAVVRKGKIVMKTKTKMHAFSTPYQLARIPRGLESRFLQDSVNDAELASFEVCAGDIIVMASDGVWDNLFDSEILSVLEATKGATVQERADAITQKAFAKSVSFEATPFAQGYVGGEEGWIYLGGKPDDITTIIAEVQVED